MNWRLHFCILTLSVLLNPAIGMAHQAPYTNILLDISTKRVAMELQIPVPELALAFGQEIGNDPATIVGRYGTQLKEYLVAHIHPFVSRVNPWRVRILSMDMDKGTQVLSGQIYDPATTQVVDGQTCRMPIPEPSS